jgi:DNA-binding XRE family transcriptional regulator
MSMVNVTDIVINEEAKELKEILTSNPAAKVAYEQFEAECKLRRELANARKQQNISQTELRERTGLTQQVISRIEKEHDISPSLKNLIKYVNAIGYELTLQQK